MATSSLVFRKGLDLKDAVAAQLNQNYHSELIEQIKAALPDCSISLLANIQKMAMGETSTMRSGLHYRIRRTEDD